MVRDHMNHCRYCGQPEKLIKAHVIPEAFFRELDDGTGAPLLVSGSPGEFQKRVPIGVYDQTMLCAECEANFAATDSYAAGVFLNDFDSHFQPVAYAGEVIALLSSTADRMRLLHFLVSVLWRASVSTHRFYSRVKLGPLENLALNAIEDRPSNVPREFDAIISFWKTSPRDTVTAPFLDPTKERWDGISGFRVYLGRCVAYIKTDKRPFPVGLKPFFLCEGDQVVLLGRSFERSKDFQAMQTTAQRSHSNLEDIRKTSKVSSDP
jgi:hypothetical protein